MTDDFDVELRSRMTATFAEIVYSPEARQAVQAVQPGRGGRLTRLTPYGVAAVVAGSVFAAVALAGAVGSGRPTPLASEGTERRHDWLSSAHCDPSFSVDAPRRAKGLTPRIDITPREIRPGDDVWIGMSAVNENTEPVRGMPDQFTYDVWVANAAGEPVYWTSWGDVAVAVGTPAVVQENEIGPGAHASYSESRWDGTFLGGQFPHGCGPDGTVGEPLPPGAYTLNAPGTAPVPFVILDQPAPPSPSTSTVAR